MHSASFARPGRTPRCRRTRTSNASGHSSRSVQQHDNLARAKALVLTLRYSGMRIGDVVGHQRSHLKGDKLFLNTQKSGSRIYVPLPKVAVEALKAIENGSTFFSWTGKGLRKRALVRTRARRSSYH